MEVSDIQKTVTHAVISGAQAIDFGITDNPEFFNVLSSSLYTDQILAVVREIICNAWDIHIEYGCIDKPIEITLKDGYLIIKDYGPGIPHRLIGAVYGTYGGSTKVKNSNVTGGFGLGCKAPFAYVDDFEVTSCSEGLKTIYRLSKSNAEVGGKPSIIPVISVPTEDTGLTVKVQVKPGDTARFTELIKRVVSNGSINATLNEEALPYLPFSLAKDGYLFTLERVLESGEQVCVRYGSVIYPVAVAPEYERELAKCQQIASSISHGSYTQRGFWRLVLQANADSLAITPSREALSNQKKTMDSLKELMSAFIARFEGKTKEHINALIKKSYDVAVDEKKWEHFLINMNHVYGFATKTDSYYPEKNIHPDLTDQRVIASVRDYSKQVLQLRYPLSGDEAKRERMARIKRLLKADLDARLKKRLKAYLRFDRSFKGSRLSTHNPYRTKWFSQHVYYPLIKGMDSKESCLKSDKLFIITNSHYSSDTFTPAGKAARNFDIEDQLAFAPMIVVLSFNRSSLTEYNVNEKIKKTGFANNNNKTFLYVSPRSPKKVEEARQHFTAVGAVLIDLTVDQQADYEENRKELLAIPAEQKTPKAKGVPLLKDLYCPTTKSFKPSLAKTLTNDKRTLTPELVVVHTNNEGNADTVAGSKFASSHAVERLYKDRLALVANSNQLNRYVKAGSKLLVEAIEEDLLDVMENSEAFRRAVSLDASRTDTADYWARHANAATWFRIIQNDPVLGPLWDVDFELTQREKDLFTLLLDNLSYGVFGGYSGKLIPARQKIPISPNLTGLISKLTKSGIDDLLKHGNVATILKRPNPTPREVAQQANLRDIIFTTLEG